jgi:peptidoglycan/LPS O-acetylase OafA/YrhL
MQPEKVYYPALTGFRAIAAYLVFFHHAYPFSAGGWSGFLYSITQEFHVGVSLFFVLSGFLIYSRYANDIPENKKWFGDYIQNRLARIYPLYFILTTVTFIVFFFQGRASDVFTYLMNITFLKGFFSHLKFTGIAQGWSLTAEECFYILAPPIFLWTRKFKLFYSLFLFLAIGSGLVLVFKDINFFGFFDTFYFMFNYTFFGRCFEFLAGIWIARNLASINKLKNLSYTYMGLFVFTIIVASLTQLSVEGANELYAPFRIAVINFILPLAIAMIIVGLIKEETLLQRMLSSSVFQLLGKSSYAFYLVHAGIFFSYAYHHITANLLLLFILLNALAVVLYYFIELPLNKKWRAKKNVMPTG